MQPYKTPPLSEAAQTRLTHNLTVAQANFANDPSLENTIWLGRRLAYLYHFDEAFAVYGAGIARFPDSHKLVRHRGHRYISTRQFDAAIADFERAAQLAANRPIEIEPDGAPNRLNQPTSTGHFNIWYHLALAYYLMGDFERAAATWRICLDRYCGNDDSLVATVDWLYMSLRRSGNTQEAARLLDRIHPQMDLIESDSYHRRLLMYKGLRSPESLLTVDDNSAEARALNLATQGYGVANWHLYNGNLTQAKTVLQQVLQTSSWTAFGFIAAEVDLDQLRD